MAKNKLQKFADMETYSHVFQYPFAVLKERGFDMRGKWNEMFFHNDNPIVLELGCGKGEYAVGLARRYPDKNFIGVDIKGARMWTGASEAKAEGIENVAFLRTHIELITHFFAPGEVSEIWITFPDPQMKKTRKRLTSTRMLELYREILKENGIIHLKSDSPFLYTYTRAMVQENNFPILIDTDDLYNSGIDDDILGIKTFYEQQWLERGKSIKYIKFVFEPRQELIEPDIEIELDDYRSFNRSKRSSKTTNKE
ncbi:MAG: tRNA (guanosine(46)-N7)-methyltransferase TrmB [Bacteroidaceae bacterium]|nr:tRNA (guanosine(46)-N7)-methyltransferase TrmB [Bacteroidaceae bacterium]